MKDTIKSVLVIDDQEEVRETVCDMLESLGYEAEAVSDERVDRYNIMNYDLIILDWYLADKDGLDFLNRSTSEHDRHECNVLLMTGAEEFVVNAAEALLQGYGHRHCGTLRKPFQMKDVEKALADIAA